MAEEEEMEFLEAKETPMLYEAIHDKEGFVVAIHAGRTESAILPPPGGGVATITRENYDKIDELISAGHRARIVNDRNHAGEIVVASEGPHPIILEKETVKEVRQRKMREIGDSSVDGRKRVFKEFPHVHLMDQHRHIDLLVMWMRGKLKDDDKILTRHLKTGEYETVKVGDLLDEIEKTFWIRQELRKHDQSYRDKINPIYKDTKKTDEQKIAEMNAVEIPAGLGVSTDSKHDNLIVEK